MPALIYRSAWGTATRTNERNAFPYNFEPSLFTGAQYCVDSSISLPPAFMGAEASYNLSARGAWVGGGDRGPDFTDTLEVVFAPPEVNDKGLPSVVAVAQILFDLRRIGPDPFVVAATRILEPLIADIHRALISVNEWYPEEFAQLRAQVDRLDQAVRRNGERPSRLRSMIAAGLSAIGAIILNILANRLDDEIPWGVLWQGVREASRMLGF